MCRATHATTLPWRRRRRFIPTIRHHAGSIIVTSNKSPDEWLASFADLLRAKSAIDRFTSNAYDLVIDGDSYRQRLKPGKTTGQRRPTKAA